VPHWTTSLLLNQVAIVTGAGSGYRKGYRQGSGRGSAILCLVGRTRETLEETADAVRTAAPRVMVSPLT